MRAKPHEIRITKAEADWIMNGHCNTFSPVPGEHYKVTDICVFVVTNDDLHYLHNNCTFVTKVEDGCITFEPVAKLGGFKEHPCIIDDQASEIVSGERNYFIADANSYGEGQLIRFEASGDLNGRKALITDVYELYSGEAIFSFQFLTWSYDPRLHHHLGEVKAILQPKESPAYVAKDGTVHFARIGDLVMIDGNSYLRGDGVWFDEQYAELERQVWSK